MITRNALDGSSERASASDGWRSVLGRLRASERVDIAVEAWEVETAETI
jgi:hypothetical protein